MSNRLEKDCINCKYYLTLKPPYRAYLEPLCTFYRFNVKDGISVFANICKNRKYMCGKKAKHFEQKEQ